MPEAQGPPAYPEPDRCAFREPDGTRCEHYATDRRTLGAEPVPTCSVHWIAGGFVYAAPEVALSLVDAR